MPLEIKGQQLQEATTELVEDGQIQEPTRTPQIMQGSFIAQQSGNYHIQITDVEVSQIGPLLNICSLFLKMPHRMLRSSRLHGIPSWMMLCW